ncbi:segregation/condensation protein A [Mycoplasma struthionis]|uniref:Segregation and condensation protein A n=2 Tax=Mycoplasma struthionis TaxID=538220 RepID=A0A502M237_9MOLU|nr:segregation/condensation protein A [Mycoplasma struthionis]
MLEEIKKPEVREISIEPNLTEENENEVKKDDLREHNIFHLENFDGSLDLLSTLIREKKIDIFEVNLLELSNQYLEIIKTMQSYEFDIASEYLVMAASLLQLKARMILQDPEVEEEVKEQKKRLLEQIAEYEKFKEISEVLRIQEEKRALLYEKAAEDSEDFIREIDNSVLDGHSNSSKLVATIRRMFERVQAKFIRKVTINTIAISPEEQKKRILKLFENREEVDFEEIFDVPSKGHFVITLLALLDLARQQKVEIYQEENEGPITFKRGVEYEK